MTKYAEQNGAVKVLPTYSNQTYMIMAGVGILIISIFVFVWWRKKNEKQREELKAS
ncbi:hypothetical protein bthur0012_55180 [Bacillus thuringiensis serovar pulsiensis BGSC 4CC1]|nr:hypothetical protein bthur0012_55180 [Bacillus thuringiensis serovar pulsiensis BGSC 4CC1]